VRSRFFTVDLAQRRDGEWMTVECGRLSRPVPNTATVQQRVRGLEDERNARRPTIYCQYTSQQARAKLKKRYPVVNTYLD
jgi:hypothetical protein